MTNNDEFFIGWETNAPPSYAKKGRTFVILLIFIIILLSLGWVISQRGFAGSTFELGKLSTIEGKLQIRPVPLLKVNYQGEPHSVLLIGFGKMGAEATLSDIEKVTNESLIGKNIKLRGTLIFHNGKTLLELTQGSESFQGFSNQSNATNTKRRSLGEQSLKGEILDPKCALGVMKPGFGKPHRSCAVRCLSGGIPPILKITNKEGGVNYCILLGEDGQAINKKVLPYVADQIRICGTLEEQDDWLVLYTNPESDILRLSPFWMGDNIPMCN